MAIAHEGIKPDCSVWTKSSTHLDNQFARTLASTLTSDFKRNIGQYDSAVDLPQVLVGPLWWHHTLRLGVGFGGIRLLKYSEKLRQKNPTIAFIDFTW